MVRYALRRAALLGASLVGAMLLAAAVAALSEPGATASAGAFFSALFAKAPGALTLDLGQSSISGIAAAAEAAPAFRASFELLIVGIFIAIVVGIPLGMALASPDTRAFVTAIVQLAGSLPVFCAGLIIGFVFVKFMPPSEGNNAPSLFDAFAAGDSEMLSAALFAIAPAGLTVGLAGAGAVALAWRNALDIAAAEHYRDGLRRLGLSEREIFNIYVVRHAIALTLRELPDILLALFAATAVAEWIFAREGAGAAFIHAVALEDWAVAAVILLVIAIIRSAADFAGPLAAHALIGDEAAS
jgi:ABC-type dipeptide/oligopeptide/nickel transport system permease component